MSEITGNNIRNTSSIHKHTRFIDIKMNSVCIRMPSVTSKSGSLVVDCCAWGVIHRPKPLNFPNYFETFLSLDFSGSNLGTAYPISAVAEVSFSSLVAAFFSTFSRSSLPSLVTSVSRSLLAFTSSLISSSSNFRSAPDFCQRTHSRLSKMVQ